MRASELLSKTLDVLFGGGDVLGYSGWARNEYVDSYDSSLCVNAALSMVEYDMLAEAERLGGETPADNDSYQVVTRTGLDCQKALAEVIIEEANKEHIKLNILSDDLKVKSPGSWYHQVLVDWNDHRWQSADCTKLVTDGDGETVDCGTESILCGSCSKMAVDKMKMVMELAEKRLIDQEFPGAFRGANEPTLPFVETLA